MQNLDNNTAVSLLEIVSESIAVTQEITKKLTAVDAPSSVTRINSRASNSLPYLAVDGRLPPETPISFATAGDAVDCMEYAHSELQDVQARRKMSPYSSIDIAKRVTLLAQRLYRNMHDAVLTPEDKRVMAGLFELLGVPRERRFWQDVPMRNWTADNLWGGYKELHAPITGLVVFLHCYGYTFIDYKKGQAQPRGWTVTLDGMQDAVATAKKKNIKAGMKLIMARKRK